MSNVLTDAYISRVVSLLGVDITYIGIGTGASPVASDTLLNSETNRKLATILLDGDTLVLDGFWDETEANGLTFTTAGAFGNGATATLNSGLLAAAGTINVAKDNTQSLTVSVEILVEAVNT